MGSHLCRRLISGGDHVICLDNMVTGRMENIGDLLGHPRFELIRQDVAQPVDLAVDMIYNLACPASPAYYQKSPTSTTKTNVLGIINMLDLATKYGALLMQFSTSEVYGDPLVHPQPEGYYGHVNPIGVRACYDEGKRCAETFCFGYRREFGTKIKVIRIFNTYGPGMDPADGRVISNFIVQALKGDNITIYGDGSQTRSFCYVDDLIEGAVRMSGSGGDFCGPVNLGNPDEISILALAREIIRLTKSASGIVFMPLPQDDPAQRRPVIDLAGRELQWHPKICLREGLSLTIDYFKKMI